MMPEQTAQGRIIETAKEARGGERGPSMVVVMAARPITKRGLTLQAGQTLDVGPVRADGSAPPP